MSCVLRDLIIYTGLSQYIVVYKRMAHNTKLVDIKTPKVLSTHKNGKSLMITLWQDNGIDLNLIQFISWNFSIQFQTLSHSHGWHVQVYMIIVHDNKYAILTKLYHWKSTDKWQINFWLKSLRHNGFDCILLIRTI